MSENNEEYVVLQEFECPVCMEYMSPPIQQCTMGHTFCCNCFDKFVRCPTCRSPKGVSRAFALERIHANVTFPCKYRTEGCDTRVLGRELKAHHEKCEFTRIDCPFTHSMGCQWSGQKNITFQHCIEAHPSNVQSGNHITLKCPLFETFGKHSAFYFTIIQAYGEQFEFCWNMSPTGSIKWSVYFLGNPEDRKRYNYQISIGKPHGEFEPIVMTTSVEEMVDEADLFHPKNCLTTFFESIKKRCNKNGDLHYEVKIVDKAFESVIGT